MDPNFVARSLFLSSYRQTFDHVPYEWQVVVGVHLLLMHRKTRKFKTVFLCRPTGGGKSNCRDAIAVASPGVTINVAPLLALNADQVVKFNSRRKTTGAVAIFWDDLSLPKRIKMQTEILQCADTASYILHCSPQLIANNTDVQLFIQRLVDRRLLRLVCVDKAHLFVKFGLFFRTEFLMLKKYVFSPIRVRGNLICPVLVMTATASTRMLGYFELMTSLNIDYHSDVFWPDTRGMLSFHNGLYYPRQKLLYICHSQAIRVFKDGLKQVGNAPTNLLPINQRQGKFLYLLNGRLPVLRSSVNIKCFFDVHNLDGDILHIIGTMRREEKFHRTSLFLNPQMIPASDRGDFNAIGCSITRDLGSAGWDDEYLMLAFSGDMPPNLMSISQEKGRTGRCSLEANRLRNDVYIAVFGLDDYMYLVQRVFNPDKIDVLGKRRLSELGITLVIHQQNQMEDLKEVLYFFLFPGMCQHVLLAKKCANPFLNEEHSHTDIPPCLNRCQYCIDKGRLPASFELFTRAGTVVVLSSLVRDVRVDKRVNGKKGGFIKAIIDYPNCRKLIWDSDSAKKPEQAMVKRLLFVLVGVGILDFSHIIVDVDRPATLPSISGVPTPIVEPKKEVHLYVKMNETFIETNGRVIPIKSIYDDRLWNKIRTK